MDASTEPPARLGPRLSLGSRRLILGLVVLASCAVAAWAAANGHRVVAAFALQLAVTLALLLVVQLLPWPRLRAPIVDRTIAGGVYAATIYYLWGREIGWLVMAGYAVFFAIAWLIAALVRRRLHGELWSSY